MRALDSRAPGSSTAPGWDDDRPIPRLEASRMIRRLIASAIVPAGRVVATNRPKPSTARPAAAGIAGRRIVIPGYDHSDPKLAEVLAELEAKQIKGREREGSEQP
jgi:hypothetical protein